MGSQVRTLQRAPFPTEPFSSVFYDDHTEVIYPSERQKGIYPIEQCSLEQKAQRGWLS